MTRIFEPFAIGDGQLPAAQTTLYTVPADTVVILTSISLYNRHSATLSSTIYINRTGSDRIVLKLDLASGDSAYLQGNFVLETGDTIAGVAASASLVDYLLSGSKG